VAQLKAAACALYGLAEGDVELWDYYRNEKYGSLEDKLDSRVAGATIMDKQAILLDLKVGGGWVGERGFSCAY
jgi:hypothetical protein